MSKSLPTVAVVVPTFREADAIDACLNGIAAQTYGAITEVFVVDGMSDDGTQARAGKHAGVVVLENPRRRQAAALNIALQTATADVIVRVDGHCIIASDYVEQCVRALTMTGAAMVGGAMTPVAQRADACGIAAAMASPFGAGPARFHVGGEAGWVDTVYLGAYWRDRARTAGGYAEDVGVNEDAEFAHRMRAQGGVWFDPAIRSQYTPRSSLWALARQFYRYGRSRARTARRHPDSVQPRQLAAPLLVIGLLTPKRRAVVGAYGAVVALALLREGRALRSHRSSFVVALPIMHVSWGIGFLVGLVQAFPEPDRSS